MFTEILFCYASVLFLLYCFFHLDLWQRLKPYSAVHKRGQSVIITQIESPCLPCSKRALTKSALFCTQDMRVLDDQVDTQESSKLFYKRLNPSMWLSYIRLAAVMDEKMHSRNVVSLLCFFCFGMGFLSVVSIARALLSYIWDVFFLDAAGICTEEDGVCQEQQKHSWIQRSSCCVLSVFMCFWIKHICV